VPALTESLRGYLAALGTPPHCAAMLDAVLDCLDTGVIAFDAAGRTIRSNRAMREAMGLGEPGEPVSAIGRQVNVRLWDGSGLPEDRWPVRRALRGEDVDGMQVLVTDPEGRERCYTVNARPVRDRTGAIVAAISAAHDMSTDRRTRQCEDCKNAVLRELATDPESPDIADRVLTAIGTTLGWSYLRLWLVDDVTGRLHPVAMHADADHPPLPLPASFAPGEGLAGRCWQHGELIWVPDLGASDVPLLPGAAASAGYRSAGAVPVRSGDRVIGSITFLSRPRQDADHALGLLLTALDLFRAGTLLICAALLAGAVMRWILPSVGMLAVRSRFTDIATYGVLGLVIALLAMMAQPEPWLVIPFLKDALHFTVSS